MTEEKIQQMPRERDDDLTLRDLIIAFRTYRREAFRFWWLYLLGFVLIGGFLAYRALSTPAKYEAHLTYMLNEDEGAPLGGGVSSLLGQFGLGRRGGRYNLDKLVELAKSRRIVQQVLLTALPDSTPATYIGNALISEYGLGEQWADMDPEMAGFRFTHDSIAAFDSRERNALLALHGLLIGGENNEGLVSASYNDLSGILTLTCSTTDELLSLGIASIHFDRLSQFYINQAIERQQQTHNLVRAKVDSIAAELAKADVQLAVFTDASNNLFSRVDQVKGQRLLREIAKLSAMQAEAVKNMEYAEFMLKNARPVIQELDIPISPLQPTKPSLLKALVIGAAIAFVLATLYVVMRRIFREAMVESEVRK